VSLEEQIRGLRSAAAFSRADQVAIVHVEGADAFDLLELASTRRLYLREGQVRHTLLLRDDGGVFADVYIGSGDDGFYVLAEGPGEAELLAWLDQVRERKLPAARTTLRGLSEERVGLGVDGPYAWEVVSGLLGPTVLGMPYLTLLRREEVLCLRAGKTGEYGYLLLCPRSEARGIEDRLADVGRSLGLVPAGLEALDACALENGHFSIRTLRETSLARPLTPIELQLQWRVAYDKDFVGAEALRSRRREGPAVRATCFTADGPVTPGQVLQVSGKDAGEVLAARFSPTLGAWVGSALLATRLAHPHVPLTASSDAGPVQLLTRTTPLVDNLSLHVDPHKHTYATREAAR
jgi:glycine cleavage system aminomethyltransferase T